MCTVPQPRSSIPTVLQKQILMVGWLEGPGSLELPYLQLEESNRGQVLASPFGPQTCSLVSGSFINNTDDVFISVDLSLIPTITALLV